MSTRQPLVSILIPCYNNASFLASTIESALAQTWPNKEIIIVDDGSTDTSLAVAKAFESDTVRVFSRTNHGSAATRNFAFLQSKGEYIQYLDADDLLDAQKIERQLILLQQREGYMASCPWAIFSHTADEAVFRSQPVWKTLGPVDWLVSSWMGGGMMQTACWLTPRSTIERAGTWNEALRRNPNDDGEFFCRVILAGKGIIFVDESKVFYRTHPGPRVSTRISIDAVTSLLGTCVSYEDAIFKVEKSPRTLGAVVNNYAGFIYRFYDEYRDLANEAIGHLKRLGVKGIPVSGGSNFVRMARFIGMRNALNLRSLFRRMA
jgi:glycosyltransferase involved in cell wall biosynthesis